MEQKKRTHFSGPTGPKALSRAFASEKFFDIESAAMRDAPSADV
jgi:hypothetical protein